MIKLVSYQSWYLLFVCVVGGKGACYQQPVQDGPDFCNDAVYSKRLSHIVAEIFLILRSG